MTNLLSMTNAADKSSVAETNFGRLDTYMRKATAALDFGSIAAASSLDLTIACTGAIVGYPVAMGLPSAPTAGLIYMAWVSAADVVTVRATNITAAPIDPGSLTFKVWVFAY
jgi:hypothetical protein